VTLRRFSPFILSCAVSAGPITWATADDRTSTCPRRPILEYPDSSSVEPAQSFELSQTLQRILRRNSREVFEDGMESELSRSLTEQIDRHGEQAISELASAFDSPDFAPHVLGEALRWVGRASHFASLRTRLWLLCNSLSHPSTLVREGAILGLASLDDRRAIPSVERAIESESSQTLRSDLVELLAQLQNPERQYALSSTQGA
jgi:hypothetical protein